MAASYIKDTHILWVGKKTGAAPAFPARLAALGCEVTIESSGAGARTALSGPGRPDVLIVDAASLRTSGARICGLAKSSRPDLPLILINSQEFLPPNGVPADVQLVLPFTIRKLANRIQPFAPGKGQAVLEAGPICLDLDRQLLRCGCREEHITPRMAALLTMLIEKKGKVIGRDALFRKAWKTDYIGDTRTLDVHISWLRKILEDDPRNPRRLTTVRGSGYRLEV